MSATLYACRAKGRKHGLKVHQKCDRQAEHHQRWCARHYTRIKKAVQAGEVTWARVENGVNKHPVEGVIGPGGTKGPGSSRPTQRPLRSKGSGTRSDVSVTLSPSVRTKLKKLHQELDPNGVPGTYSEGVLRPTKPAVLRHPEIHSCLWLHPDGAIRNYGYVV